MDRTKGKGYEVTNTPRSRIYDHETQVEGTSVLRGKCFQPQATQADLSNQPSVSPQLGEIILPGALKHTNRYPFPPDPADANDYGCGDI